MTRCLSWGHSEAGHLCLCDAVVSKPPRVPVEGARKTLILCSPWSLVITDSNAWVSWSPHCTFIFIESVCQVIKQHSEVKTYAWLAGPLSGRMFSSMHKAPGLIPNTTKPTTTFSPKTTEISNDNKNPMWALLGSRFRAFCYKVSRVSHLLCLIWHCSPRPLGTSFSSALDV